MLQRVIVAFFTNNLRQKVYSWKQQFCIFNIHVAVHKSQIFTSYFISFIDVHLHKYVRFLIEECEKLK